MEYSQRSSTGSLESCEESRRSDQGSVSRRHAGFRRMLPVSLTARNGRRPSARRSEGLRSGPTCPYARAAGGEARCACRADTLSVEPVLLLAVPSVRAPDARSPRSCMSEAPSPPLLFAESALWGCRSSVIVPLCSVFTVESGQQAGKTVNKRGASAARGPLRGWRRSTERCSSASRRRQIAHNSMIIALRGGSAFWPYTGRNLARSRWAMCSHRHKACPTLCRSGAERLLEAQNAPR